jgi:hypothetical protein
MNSYKLVRSLHHAISEKNNLAETEATADLELKKSLYIGTTL